MATHLRNDRVTLTREIVSEAALALADAEGLDALTFRRLAGVLRVTPMALYNYVASKDELIEAIGARAFGEFAFPEDEGSGWQEQLRALARAFRQLLIRHPSVAECEAKGYGLPTEAGLAIIEVLLGLLRRAGFNVEDAVLLHDHLERFVVAVVVLERQRAARDPEEREMRNREVRARLLSLPADRFANVVAAADLLCGITDPAASFELMLDLVIAGLEALLARR